MDTDIKCENFNTLKEMVLDERKLVTYISLSKELCLHVNESKLLLNQLVEDLRNNKSSDVVLNVNYIISGLLDENKALTSVCNETELQVLRNRFKTVFYQHLYSVSIGLSSKDNLPYMEINKFEDFPLCTGLIKNNTCVKRSSDEIGSLKTSSQEIVVSDHKPTISVQRKVKDESTNIKNATSNTKQVIKIQDNKSEPVIKSEITSPKKELINNSAQRNDRKNTKAQKGIAGFFNRPSVTNKKLNGATVETVSNNNNKEEKSVPEVDTKIKIEKMDVDVDISNKEVPESNKIVIQKDKSGNKSLNQIKKTAKVDKKRKRVLHVSDSESEDDKNDPFTEDPVADQESDDEIPPTPLANTVKITSGIMNPKKRRKIVDKTYTDEDGYILTKKEEVYESFSDNEEEEHIKENIKQVNKVKVEVSPPEKKNNVKSTKKKMASPQKGKQSTLMNFFKKV